MEFKAKVLFLFGIFCYYNLSAQNIVDEVKFRASYNFSYKTKPDQSNFSRTDIMFLDIGDKYAKFYSRYNYVRDSLVSASISKGGEVDDVVNKLRTYPKGNSSKIYFLLDNKTLQQSNKWATYKIFYEEPMTLPKWEINNEEKVINGYKCKKATANYMNRVWIAYFASEIPLNLGPWKLWGLPGLIVEATDEDNYFKYVLKGFEKIKQVPITLDIDKKYQKVTKEAYLKNEKLYYNDPKAFVENNLHGKIMDSNPGKNYSKSYIPLEP